MASLNLSTNGPSITKSYQSVINSPAPSGLAATSPTYGQWAVFTVAAPLVSTFQQDSGKESVLKVQSTGEGELADLVDEFSDGRIQFAFVKVKDPNTGLPKNVLIGWCGEGVPERTKGYFASHQAAASSVLHGYHVQISARSDRDLAPEGIIQKVSEASGAKYSGSSKPIITSPVPPPSAKKPVFTATRVASNSSNFNPLTNRRTQASASIDVDEDGWGHDAPPVTRTQLEKVESSYKPVKVDIGQLREQKQETLPSKLSFNEASNVNSNVVKGGYQPVGKVDIAAIRRQAAESGQIKDERPAPVKGAYEPVGKVDIAGIRAKAQPPPHRNDVPSSVVESSVDSSDHTRGSVHTPPASFQPPGRLSELPKPKLGSRIGPGGDSFVGTKAPVPSQFANQSSGAYENPSPMGPGRTFASSAVKSPAQVWAEKRAAQGENVTPVLQTTSEPVAPQNSGGWKSGYEGKKWATVQTAKDATPAPSTENLDNSSREAAQPSLEIGAIRNQFAQASSIDLPAPNLSTKPSMGGDGGVSGNTGHEETSHDGQGASPATLTATSAVPDVETEEPGSPVRIAVPVARGSENQLQEEPRSKIAPSSTPMMEPLEKRSVHDGSIDNESRTNATPDHAASKIEESPAASVGPAEIAGDKTAIAQYDYEKAEDNELELREGERITNIEMVDTDWWMGQNSRGEVGLFPSNYVELEEEPATTPQGSSTPTGQVQMGEGRTATAQYDYEAAEDNELSFPEGAKITNVEFPDDDWWSGEYKGIQGLFPANFVELDK